MLFCLGLTKAGIKEQKPNKSSLNKIVNGPIIFRTIKTIYHYARHGEF